MRIDPRFTADGGVVGFTGNELLVKGALEAGVQLLTGYPGSPISGVFETIEALAPLLVERGVVAHIAGNEALAAARLSGACQAGLRAVAVMKSVGMHVASDALATGNLVEFRRPEGGGVVVVGDDPWNESTQINSDSRFLSMHLNMPVVEPGSLQQVKDFVGAALELSGAADLLVTYVITTNQADAGGTVVARPNVLPGVSAAQRTTFASDAVATGDVIMVPPFITQREASLAGRYARLHERARALGLDRRFGPAGHAPVGFVSSGLSAPYLRKVLELAGLWERVPVLELGLTYPVDAERVLAFAADLDHLVVVEEKRAFVETQVERALAAAVRAGRLARAPQTWGKQFPGGRPGFPNVGGLNPSVVLDVLGPELMRHRDRFPSLDGDRVAERLAQVLDTAAAARAIPRRTPTFCPGCPHRDSAVAATAVKNRLKAAPRPLDVVVHGESGCHTMLGFAPFSGLMQNYVGMGLGGGSGAGMGPFVDNPHLVFLGDSTFFHSGMAAISDSVKHGLDVTYVVLDNRTTAMTGHQPTAENGRDVMGREAAAQDIERIVRGMLPPGVTLLRVDPARRDAYERVLDRALRTRGVKVLIADKECAITRERRENARRRRIVAERGFLAREERLGIDTDVCDHCLECVKQTACPGLAIVETALGPKIGTDVSLCVDDGACARTHACPSFARLTIRRRRPAPPRVAAAAAERALPAPPAAHADTWSAYFGGVGGMGIGLLTGIVARAGEIEGFHSHFVNRNGLAIRNGGVYGHVVLSRVGPPGAPHGFYGDADLVLGVDLLEACRGVHPGGNLRVAHPARTRAVVDVGRHETVLSRMGEDVLDVGALVALLRSRTRPDASLFADYARVAEERLGSRVYANVLLLGVAFQHGWLPVGEDAIATAIGQLVRPAERANNLAAFRLGRELALDPSPASPLAAPAIDPALLERVDLDVPDTERAFVARAMDDLRRDGGPALAARYLEQVRLVCAVDSAARGWRATRAAARAFHGLMAPFDAFRVARLLTAPEKRERDRRRYDVDPARGDSIRYRFLTRPRVSLFGRTVEVPVAAPPWLLRVVAKGAFLRAWWPGWNREDRAFCAWFTAVVDGLVADGDGIAYDALVAVLEQGTRVRGYRDVRSRARDAVREAVGSLVPQRADRVDARGARGGIDAADHARRDREQHRAAEQP